MIVFKINQDEDVYLYPVKISEEGETPIFYDLRDEQGKNWMSLQLVNSQFKIIRKDNGINESEENINIMLDDLVLTVIEAEQSGSELTDIFNSNATNPYNPESIKVQTKTFNVTLIADMIDRGYIDLNPDFQRNFVWTPILKSRLIESILLRIPLPMFYFSEDEEGLITVVDGLQRLTTIKEFMDNKFPLRDLEYLSSTCHGRYYSDINKDGTPNGKKAIDAKYFRWFNMTQFTVNVIDPSSPAKVKYDIFKRINTSGKPLNSQEIRNCLAGKNLRTGLNYMTNLDSFKWATNNSIRPVRMEDKEVVLRFICFYHHWNDPIIQDRKIDNYNGDMETALDDLTEQLSKSSLGDFERYYYLFDSAMKNAGYLFGEKYAFRKVLPKHLKENAGKQLINKALFVSLSVILSKYDSEKIRQKMELGSLTRPLAELIERDNQLYQYLSYGTNGKANLQYVFAAIEKFINEHVKR
jgi:hypothetical protein